jgi:DNA-binding IclR family transcriptional regulator
VARQRAARLFEGALRHKAKAVAFLPVWNGGPLSQSRIAERLDESRAMVNRLLQDLVRGGYIEMSRDRIVLLASQSDAGALTFWRRAPAGLDSEPTT